MASLSAAHSNNLLDASLGTATIVATVTPMKCRLMTANGTTTTNGTEVTGGSYVSQTVTFSAATGSGSTSNNIGINFGGMPATTVVGVELWDSAGTPIRKHFGALTASKTTNAGDTLSIPISSLAINFT